MVVRVEEVEMDEMWSFKRLARKTIYFSKSEWLHDVVIELFINLHESADAV